MWRHLWLCYTVLAAAYACEWDECLPEDDTVLLQVGVRDLVGELLVSCYVPSSDSPRNSLFGETTMAKVCLFGVAMMRSSPHAGDRIRSQPSTYEHGKRKMVITYWGMAINERIAES